MKVTQFRSRGDGQQLDTTRQMLAKLSPPRLPAHVLRSRLLRRLDESEASMLWVAGPAGSGKTTLVASWLERIERPQFWFHFDEGDRDPSAFITYLVLLAARLGGQPQQLPYLTPEHFTDLEGFCRPFFRSFYTRFPAGSVFIFENCHLAAVDTTHTIVRVACEELPSGMRLVGISRHQPPPEFVKLRANRTLALLEAEDLVLDTEETRAIAQAAGIGDGTQIEVLFRACRGWVAGLVLLLSQRQQALNAQALTYDSREALFDYFAGEILRNAGADLRDLLLRTALLPVVSEESACELTGNGKAGELLNLLYRQNCFTTRRGGATPTYVYHDLFRAFLLDRLVKEVDAGEMRALRASAARMLEQTGYISEALSQYAKQEDWSSIERIIRSQAQRLIDQGNLKTLNEWLGQVPPERITNDPWLTYFQGVSIGLRSPREARDAFERAYDSFLATGDETGQFSAAFAVMEVMLVISESFKPWDRWIDILEGLFDSHPPTDNATGVRAWYAFLNACLYRKPGHRLIPRAVRYLDEQCMSGSLNSTLAVQAATGLLAYAHFASDESLAQRIIPVIRGLLSQKHLAVFSRIWGLQWLAVYHFFQGHWQECLVEIAPALELSERNGIETVHHIGLCYRIQSLAHLGRWQEALETANSLQVKAGSHYWYVTAYLHAVIAVTRYTAGESHAALQHGSQSLALWEQTGFLLAEASQSCQQSIYHLAEGNALEAQTHIRRAQTILEGTCCTFLDPLIGVLQAKQALLQSRHEDARIALRRTFAMCMNRKRAAAMRWARSFLPEVFSFALAEDLELALVTALIAEWRLRAPDIATLDWPWPIQIRTFGGFEIRLGGQPLNSGRKSPRRLLALIKYLAASGPQGVPTNQLSDALWPEAEGDVAQGNLRTALFRARRLLGSEQAIELCDGRVALNGTLVWVDCTAFAQLVLTQITDDAAIRIARELYRGDFLPDDDEPWVLAFRDTWRKQKRRLGLEP